jgi:hypothetical protein
MSSPNWWGDWRPTLTPHTGNLQATDLIECTSIVGGLPVNTAITGAQIIAAASGGSGLTIGTTGITSGTIGRVLFQGTGNVLQQSTNLFWDNTNNRLGVGTSTPAHSFEVSNTVGGSSTPTLSLATSTYSSQIIAGNSTYPFASGANSLNIYHAVAGTIAFYNGSASPTLRMSILSDGKTIIGNATTASKIFEVNNQINGGGIGLNTSGVSNTQISITHTASGGNSWTFNSAATGSSQTAGTLSIGSTTNNMLLFSNGNVVLGPLNSSNAGFKLDVNGTARVQGNLDVSGSNILTTRYLNMNSALGLSRIEYSYSGGTLLQLGRMQGAAGLTRQFDIISKTPNYGVTSQQILTLFPSASIKYDNSAATSSTIATETTSACFEVFSTNKGFLPPRMTNAQMLAIATPAAGLVVYDTTNNKHCGYNGTAWQNFY